MQATRVAPVDVGSDVLRTGAGAAAAHHHHHHPLLALLRADNTRAARLTQLSLAHGSHMAIRALAEEELLGAPLRGAGLLAEAHAPLLDTLNGRDYELSLDDADLARRDERLADADARASVHDRMEARFGIAARDLRL